MSGDSTERPATQLTPVPDQTNTGSGVERRTLPRYPFTAAAEVVDIKSKTRVAGRSGDVGPGGCYVDTISPFPVGATVRVRLEHNQSKFEAVAVVTYSLASMGMGISFTEIKPDQRGVLQAWVAELSGEPLAVSDPPPVPEPPPITETPDTSADTSTEDNMADTISNVRQVMNEFINLMIRKKIITEKEGAGLLRQLFQ